jgi:hypothetical protein
VGKGYREHPPLPTGCREQREEYDVLTSVVLAATDIAYGVRCKRIRLW